METFIQGAILCREVGQNSFPLFGQSSFSLNGLRQSHHTFIRIYIFSSNLSPVPKCRVQSMHVSRIRNFIRFYFSSENNYFSNKINYIITCKYNYINYIQILVTIFNYTSFQNFTIIYSPLYQ